MIIKLGASPKLNRLRLSGYGILVKGDVTFDTAGFSFREGTTIAVKRNAISLEVNPKVLEIVGNKSIAAPAWLHPGDQFDGQLNVIGGKGLTEDQEDKLAKLPYIFRARVMFVGVPTLNS